MTDEPEIITRVAHASYGDNRFRGFGVGAELVLRVDSWSLRALAVGHRILTEDERWLLDQLTVVNAVADPRIWPLKVTRIVSSFGAYVPALAAGYLCSDQGVIGPTAFAGAARRLCEIQATLGDERDPSRIRGLVEQRLDAGPLEGFGVAFRDRDERVKFLGQAVSQAGRSELPFWTLASAIDVVASERGRAMNIGGGGAAVMLDMGFTPAQVEFLVYELTNADFIANAAEGSQQPAEILRALPQSWVEYRGPASRRTPRAPAG